jgi:trimethylamine--corrinoid protein Co-methyltransferase
MILSFDQLLIDVEVFKMCQRVHSGITTREDRWLENVIDRVGPGGSFIAERSTVKGIRGGAWYISELGVHTAFEEWEADGRPRLLEEVQDRVDQILTTHKPLPLAEDVEQELARIRACAAAHEKGS